ncbi:MAG: radical SAM protein with 4Fe4S-binding SPASM domain [Myxococcota bacterium]|jgi:radical SAM protein with 4Fe4S-binding SPASM domain
MHEATALFEEAMAQLDASVAGFPPALAGLWQSVVADWRTRLPDGAPGELFCAPTGTPALSLLLAISEERTTSAQRLGAAEAMLASYFAVRCQDDVIDAGAPVTRLYLQQALSDHALSCLVRLVPDPAAMVSAWAVLSRDFADAALTDARLRADFSADWSDEAVAMLGRKYLPMVGPLHALMLADGRLEQVDALRAGIETLAVGLQLTNDLLGERTDLAEGVRSPWLAAIGISPLSHTTDDLTPGLRRALQSGALGRYFARIRSALDAAEELLVPLCSPRLSDHLDTRRKALAALETRLAMRAALLAPRVNFDIELTRRCNLRCAACFVFEQEPDLNNLDELPTELVLSVLDELAGFRALLHITGGEPFMHPGIWTILSRAAQLGVEGILINTNGTRMDAASIEKLSALSVPVRLLVSIDGPPGVHETSRGRTVTDQALTAIRDCVAAGVDAQPASILTSELVEFGVGAWQDWLTQTIGTPLHLTLWPLFLKPTTALPHGAVGHMLTPAEMGVAADQLAPRMLSGIPGITVADYPVINPLLAARGVPRDALWQCDAGRGRLCLQADRTITPCHPFRLEVDTLDPGRIGGSITRALRRPLYQKLGARNHLGCSSCEEKPICGSCQAVVVGRGHPLFGHDGFCIEARGLDSPDWKPDPSIPIFELP